jgi:hypothetical protein
MLEHVLRVRQNDDYDFVRPGLADAIVINANQLENSIQSATATLWHSAMPFSVDPVLWRFQVPEWWRNEKGETKRNYRKLGAAYVQGTGLSLDAGPIASLVESDGDWAAIGGNALRYARDRLRAVPTQLEAFAADGPRDLVPSELIAPALVAFTTREDHINRILFDAAAHEAGG